MSILIVSVDIATNQIWKKWSSIYERSIVLSKVISHAQKISQRCQEMSQSLRNGEPWHVVHSVQVEESLLTVHRLETGWLAIYSVIRPQKNPVWLVSMWHGALYQSNWCIIGLYGVYYFDMFSLTYSKLIGHWIYHVTFIINNSDWYFLPYQFLIGYWINAKWKWILRVYICWLKLSTWFEIFIHYLRCVDV